MEKYEVVKVGKPVELVRCGDYIAASDGKIYNLNYGGKRKLMEVKQYKYPYGYLGFGFHRKTMRSHRFIAMCFLPNPYNLPQVNHKNEVKTDNRVENLEWCSAKYNVNYGTRNEKLSKSMIGKNVNHASLSKPVSQFTKDGGSSLLIHP